MSLWSDLRALYADLDRRITALERGTGPSPPTPPPGGIVRAPILLGYASVHAWWMEDQVRIVNALAMAGLTLTQVEFASDEGDRGFDYAKARQFVDRCRSAGVVVLIDAVNYNDSLVRDQWSDAQYRTHVRAIRDSVGTEGVLLEPVSEPSEEKARRWHEIAREEWLGEFAVNTDDRFRPWTTGGGLADLHYCDYSALLTGLRSGRSAIHSTDCTPLLSRYWDESMTREAVGLSLEHRAPLLIYDTFPYPQGGPTRFDVIGWMGAVVQGRPVTPPLDSGTISAFDGLTPWNLEQVPANPPESAFSPIWWQEFERILFSGPTTLIAADWAKLPAVWSRTRFPQERDKLIWWVLSRRIWPIDLPAGAEGSDIRPFRDVQEAISAWWETYMARIVGLMERFPALSLTIVVGDSADDDETTVEFREGTLKLIPADLHARVTDRDRLGHPIR